MEKITIKETDIILDDLGESKGKIVVSNHFTNSSTYWGAMGGSLVDFILSIDNDYFANRLCSNRFEFNKKATFANVRRFIREEMDLPWYKEVNFQKDLRWDLNKFQENCYSEESFVNGWDSFINNLSYHNLECQSWESESIEKSFKGICEHWNFIGKTESQEYKFYLKLLPELKKELKKVVA